MEKEIVYTVILEFRPKVRLAPGPDGAAQIVSHSLADLTSECREAGEIVDTTWYALDEEDEVL
jgi:hypothetical protein